MSRNKILELINSFIDRRDISVSLAQEIEVAIDDEFPNDDYMQDVVVMLASYRPGGGENLYDEETLSNKLAKVRERILLQLGN